MSIECYLDNCPHHSDYKLGDRESQGPFCSLMDCAWDQKTVMGYLEASKNKRPKPMVVINNKHFAYVIKGILEGTVRNMSGSVFARNITEAFIKVIEFWTADPAIMVAPTHLSIKAIEEAPCKPSQEPNT